MLFILLPLLFSSLISFFIYIFKAVEVLILIVVNSAKTWMCFSEAGKHIRKREVVGMWGSISRQSATHTRQPLYLMIIKLSIVFFRVKMPKNVKKFQGWAILLKHPWHCSMSSKSSHHCTGQRKKKKRRFNTLHYITALWCVHCYLFYAVFISFVNSFSTDLDWKILHEHITGQKVLIIHCFSFDIFQDKPHNHLKNYTQCEVILSLALMQVPDVIFSTQISGD